MDAFINEQITRKKYKKKKYDIDTHKQKNLNKTQENNTHTHKQITDLEQYTINSFIHVSLWSFVFYVWFNSFCFVL